MMFFMKNVLVLLLCQNGIVQCDVLFSSRPELRLEFYVCCRLWLLPFVLFKKEHGYSNIVFHRMANKNCMQFSVLRNSQGFRS